MDSWQLESRPLGLTIAIGSRTEQYMTELGTALEQALWLLVLNTIMQVRERLCALFKALRTASRCD
jgi:hypothetical protein